MFVPDHTLKTVSIPVRIVNGELKYIHGRLPKINDTHGELRIPAIAFQDAGDVSSFEEASMSEMLPEGAELLISVKPDSEGPGLIKYPPWSEPDRLYDRPERFVRLTILKRLFLRHRGTKTSILCQCECILPDLNIKAHSLNHAYSIASQTFETKRLSHTGNVFRYISYEAAHGWEFIGSLRERLDAKFEAEHLRASDEQEDDRAFSRLFLSAGFDQDPGSVRAAEAARAYDGMQAWQFDTPPDVNEMRSDSDALEKFDDYLQHGWYHYNKNFIRQSRSGRLTTLPLRVRVKQFRQSKSQRKVWRINSDLKVEIAPIGKLREGEVELFTRFLERLRPHPPERVFLPKPDHRNVGFYVYDKKRLIAVSYLEVGGTSTHAYFAMFEPGLKWRGLGILTILKEIEYSKALGKTFYYLGYSYHQPTSWDYKKKFAGLEGYDWLGNWRPLPRLK